MKEKNENKAQKAKIDPALVAQARAGDQSAFTALYEQTHTAIYRSIRSMVHDEDLAWDILQDCYLKAFQGLDKLEADGAFLTWLRRIAVNETASRMSKRLPVTFTELGDGEDETMPELPDPDPEVQPELALDRQETSRLVREILAELPEQQQLIVGMRYYEDLSIKEIAELLHLAPGTIKTQLHFGRKKVETKVRALEKQGLKLYGLAPFPFLLALLLNLEPGEALGQKALSTVLAQAPTATAAAGAGSAAAFGAVDGEVVKVTAMTAGQAIRHGLAAKLAAGALALCVIGGGIWAGSKALNRENPVIGDERLSVTETEHAHPTQEPTTPTTESIRTEEPTEQTELTISQQPTEPEPGTVLPAPDELYAPVLDQYRQALADPDFTPEAYPLVNPEIVSNLAQRWSRFAEDEIALYASCYDIDGNGTQELIIARPDTEEVTSMIHGGKSIFAIYTWYNEAPVMLLGREDVALNDRVTIYDSGLILCVNNSFLTNPCQATAYRIDGNSGMLLEQGQWTHSFTETGERSFTSADGVLTPEEFYADFGREKYIREWECVASNPGTAEAGPVTDLAGVEDGSSRLPKINLEGEVFVRYNEEIEEEYLEDDYIFFDYEWTLNGDILCVWIHCYEAGTYIGKISCFSVSEGRELSDNELLERCGIDKAEFVAGLSNALYGAFASSCDNEVYGLGYGQSDLGYHVNNMQELVEDLQEHFGDSQGDSWSNNTGNELVLDRNGRLAMFSLVSSLAGGDYMMVMIPVLWCD